MSSDHGSRSIELRGATFGYFADQPVLQGVDLTLGPGLTLLLGPNGSGKSTLLKLAAGVEMPDAGQVLVNGFDLWQQEVEARRDLAYLPEHPDLSPYATLLEVLHLVCRLRGQPLSDARQALEHFDLGSKAHDSVRQLSKGQRRRVTLAAAHIGSPRTLLLDEPLDALDRGLRRRVLQWLDEQLAAGALVLVVTHELEPFVERADRVVAASMGELELIEELPEGTDERHLLFERLAGGQAG